MINLAELRQLVLHWRVVGSHHVRIVKRIPHPCATACRCTFTELEPRLINAVSEITLDRRMLGARFPADRAPCKTTFIIRMLTGTGLIHGEPLILLLEASTDLYQFTALILPDVCHAYISSSALDQLEFLPHAFKLGNGLPLHPTL